MMTMIDMSSASVASLHSSGALDFLPDPMTSKPTMLVVDDEDGPRQSLHVVFKDDFQVFMASDGREAIDLAQRHRIDVAVLDIRMSGMTGIEVLERLKFIDPSIEAVMMTAFETNDTLRQALRLQACDYVNKPFDVSRIRAAVDAALERRTLSHQLLQTNAAVQHLQSEVEQRRVEEQIVRTQGEIYAGVIHDLNGPLTVISGLLHLVGEQLAEQSELPRENLEQVKDGIKKISRHVTACIDIARRHLNIMQRLPAERTGTWVNQALGDLGELARAHPSKRNSQILIHPLPDDVQALVNGTDLMQILLNLTLNALQCSSHQIRVTVQGQLLHDPLPLDQYPDGPEDRFVNREGLYNVAPLLALTVEDNGPGMAPDVLPKIFEPFYSSKSRPHGSGTGLGLCIVSRLLKQAGGGLHVHTCLGQGTLFTVYLPARAFPPNESPVI